MILRENSRERPRPGLSDATDEPFKSSTGRFFEWISMKPEVGARSTSSGEDYKQIVGEPVTGHYCVRGQPRGPQLVYYRDRLLPIIDQEHLPQLVNLYMFWCLYTAHLKVRFIDKTSTMYIRYRYNVNIALIPARTTHVMISGCVAQTAYRIDLFVSVISWVSLSSSASDPSAP